VKKKFLSNLALLIILNILIKPFWFFGIEVAVQNRVGEAMYGFYFSLFNFAFIMNILLDLGITNYNNRAVARDHSILTRQLSQIIPLKFLLSIVYALVVFITAFAVGYSQLQMKLLLILVLNQFISSFILYLRSNISGIQKFRTDSLISVLDRTLMIIMNSILLWTGITGGNYKIEWFVYTQTASYLLTATIVFAVIRFYSGKLRFSFNPNAFKKILKQSYPFALLILLMSFFNRVDSVMIERLLPDGKEQAGIYAQSFRVLDAFSQFSLLFAGLLLPMFSKMLKGKEKTDDLVYMASSILLAISLGVAVAGAFFNNDIIFLMYGHTAAVSPKIFSILMNGFVFISIGYVYGTLLTANNSLKHLNILASITVGINITLNLLLIPRYQAIGAAIASITSQGFYAIAQVFLAHKLLHIKLQTDFYIRLLVYIAGASLTGWILKVNLSWGYAILLFVLTCIILAIATRIIKPKELAAAFREE